MKKILLLILVLLITGCSSEKSIISTEVNKNEEDNVVDEENADKDLEDRKLSDKDAEPENVEAVEELPTLENIIDARDKDEEKEVLPIEIEKDVLEYKYIEGDINYAEVSIEYPILKNTLSEEYEEGVAKINEFFYENALALYEENKTYADDRAVQIKEEGGPSEDLDVYCTYTITCNVTYNKYGYFSLIMEFSEYEYSMAHPNYYSTGYVFDILAGEALELTDILNGNVEEIDIIAQDSFLNNSELGKEILAESEEDIKNNLEYVKFYIEDERLVLFFDPYIVASYAVGTVRAYVDFDNEELFKINFR